MTREAVGSHVHIPPPSPSSFSVYAAIVQIIHLGDNLPESDKVEKALVTTISVSYFLIYTCMKTYNSRVILLRKINSSFLVLALCYTQSQTYVTFSQHVSFRAPTWKQFSHFYVMFPS
jgi:hypothetical protein